MSGLYTDGLLGGWGSAHGALGEAQVREILQGALEAASYRGKRVLVIIPDSTRTAPMPLLFRLLYETLGAEVARLDYLIALGTHQPMSEAAITRLVGASPEVRQEHYPKSEVFNHHWDDPAQLRTFGTIGAKEMAALTDGFVSRETPIALNRLIDDYDALLIVGPVFPHEVAGFSGGAKYLFPGIAGHEVIDSTHWLGALATSYDTIGVKDTAVRRVLHRGARFVTEQKPLVCIKLVMQRSTLHGVFVGDYVTAWERAAELSAALNIIYKPNPFRSVLSLPSNKYEDLWTAAKAMYKTEPVIAEGGEVIIYAPHLSEVSVTHGREIEAVGYHVRDYFLKQWDRFKDVSWTVLAHSTHVKGAGRFENGVETPRIQVTLATGISEEACRRINLGYRDYREIDPEHWADREDEGLLLVREAGEMLYRLEGSI